MDGIRSGETRKKRSKNEANSSNASSNEAKIKENKEKKNKINKNKSKEFVPPSLDDIKKYISEKDLKKVNAEHFYQFFSESDWVDSKGNEVKNWKLKLLTWNNYGNEKTKTEKRNNVNNYEQREDVKWNDFYSNRGG